MHLRESFVRLPCFMLVSLVSIGLMNATGCGASGSASVYDRNGSNSGGTPGTTAQGTGGASNVTESGGAPVTSSTNTGGSGATNPGTTKQTGGAPTTGGSKQTGGAPTTGGSKQTGGAPTTGGSKQTGGIPATGGTKASTGGSTTTGGTKASTGGSTATGGSATASSTNPPITGSDGYATRYWDCCKPSCSWTTSVPSCQKDGTTRISDRNAKSGCDSGGSAFECYDFSPWYDSSTNMSYGFAAYNASGCGVCYQLQFTGASNSGNNPGSAAIKGKQMIVQVINIGIIEAGQFDLLIPGGGVGAMTAGCTAQWGNVDLGVTYGGLLSECNGDPSCMAGKCQSVFGSMSALLAGCNWFTGWFSSADNPRVIYKQVSCPSQITSKSGISG